MTSRTQHENERVNISFSPKVLIEAVHWKNTQTNISIDDIQFTCSITPQLGCNAKTEFQCPYTKQCVPLTSLCDFDRNCCDGTDESLDICYDYTR